ncbi:MAG: ROK family protein, partial [bacterium]
MPPPTPIFGAVEAGGTKFACAVGRGPGAGILARTQFATGSDPSRVLAQVAEWLRAQESAHGALAAIGVASFGPVDLDARSPTHGFITT